MLFQGRDHQPFLESKLFGYCLLIILLSSAGILLYKGIQLRILKENNQHQMLTRQLTKVAQLPFHAHKCCQNWYR